MKNPKVLVCAPQSDRKNYCFDWWLDSSQNLNYQNYEIFLADNSTTRKNFKRIRKLGINCEYIKPKGRDTITLIAESHEACRRFAIRNNFDYMLHLETDIKPPVDIIDQLLFHKKDVVSAMYFIGFGEGSKLMIQQSDQFSETVNFTDNLDNADLHFVDGTLKQVHHAGLGCALIKRKVFEKIPFRREKGANVHPDSFFAHDLHVKGIKQFIDTSLLCEHRNSYSHY